MRRRGARTRYLPLFDSPLLSLSASEPWACGSATCHDDLRQKLRLRNLNSVINLKMKAIDPNPFPASH